MAGLKRFLEGRPAGRVGPASRASWSHRLDPERLAALAETLYAATPPILLVSVAAGSFVEGDGLSAALGRALPEVVEAVAGVVTGQRPR
jgi:hypothetical protein